MFIKFSTPNITFLAYWLINSPTVISPYSGKYAIAECHIDDKMADNIYIYIYIYIYEDFRYMKIHIFALRWKDEIRRSSQLRTLLKLVVVSRTWKNFRLVRDLNPWPLRYRCSAEIFIGITFWRVSIRFHPPKPPWSWLVILNENYEATTSCRLIPI